MPDSNVSPGANGARIDMSQAPGADLDWDNLFPNPENPTALSPQATSQGMAPQQQPQATQSQPFLQAGSTVYNTAEDAIRGTQHKDDLIARYRSYLSTQGVDPNTLQRTAPEPQAQPAPQPTAPSKYKYYGNPGFFDEVAKAAADRDRAKYEQLLAAHSREAADAAIDERLSPWQSTLAETNRYKAFRQVTHEIPGFQGFYEGPGFKEVQDKFPLYKEMLQIGENDPNAAKRLPEVYQQMYVLYQGLNAARPQAQAQTATPSTPTVRSQPTLQPSSLTPPAPVSSTAGWQEASWRGNKSLGNDARKQLIQDGDTKFRNMRFEEVGL